MGMMALEEKLVQGGWMAKKEFVEILALMEFKALKVQQAK